MGGIVQGAGPVEHGQRAGSAPMVENRDQSLHLAEGGLQGGAALRLIRGDDRQVDESPHQRPGFGQLECLPAQHESGQCRRSQRHPGQRGDLEKVPS